MGLNIGGNIKSIYCGGNIKEAYVGSQKVFSASKIVGYALIGEHNYPYIKVGNLYWLAENLKEDLDGSIWYKNDRTTYEPLRYGKLYQYNETELNKILSNGWRLPTENEFKNLISIAGGANGLKSLSWSGGNDSLGFNAKPSGFADNSTSFQGSTYGTNIWTSTKYGSLVKDFWLYYNDAGVGSGSYTYKYFSIRLVKNA